MARIGPTKGLHKTFSSMGGLDTRLDRPIVVKVGSNVVTRKLETSGRPSLDVNLLRDLAREISRIMETTNRRVILVSSGAVAAGREVMQLDPSVEGTTPGKQALASVGQPRLMAEYERAFSLATPHRTTSQMLLTRHDFDREEGRRNMLDMLKSLPRSIVTIVNENDTVATDELNLGDNDQLAARMALLVRAELLILLTDTDGVFNKDPKQHTDARLIHELPLDQLTEELIASCGVGKSSNGTGGMASKLRAAAMAANGHIQTFIANGKREGVLAAILNEQPVGTEIKPRIAA